MKFVIFSLIILFSFQSYAFAQEANVKVFEDKYLSISQHNKEFYLINADSSQTKKLFQAKDTFYLLVFSWKYNIIKAEIIYSSTHSKEISAKHSHRCPTSNMYVPIQFEEGLPQGIKLIIKNSNNEIYLGFEECRKWIHQLKPLIDNFGYIEWNVIPIR